MKKNIAQGLCRRRFAIGELGLSLDAILAKMRSLAHRLNAAADKVNLLDLRTIAIPCEPPGIRA